mmetsp:Transcript_82781/g.146215  ORF Transcript_82781/g.146215 Transcript_82781/m.146215 type:complete len:815 (+) Transcript_82781:29-2473(+)
MGFDPSSPGGAPSPGARRWRRAVARVCAQKAVVNALEPEPAWREFRSYAALLTSGFLFSPISQAILVTSVRATSMPSNVATPGWSRSSSGPRQFLWNSTSRQRAWWWPVLWWKGLLGVFTKLQSPGSLARYLRSSTLFAIHDAVTRGRTHWVEQATDVGAVRPCRPIARSLLVEICCGAVGAQLSLEYMRSTLCVAGRGHSDALVACGPPHWQLLALGVAAGVVRSVVVVTGGHCPILQTVCSWSEFLLEVVAERQGALYLGHECPLPSYFGAVLCGIVNFLPWGLMVIPCKRLVQRFFGEDPIVAQKAALERVAKGLQQSERGRAELAIAPRRAVAFFASMEISSLWWRVRAAKGTPQLWKRLQTTALSRTASSSSITAADAREQLEQILGSLAARHHEDLHALLQEEDGSISEAKILELLDSATDPIVVRRHDMVRSALTQIADRSVEDLMLGVAVLSFPCLQAMHDEENEFTKMLGLRVQFVGEDGMDAGGVRKDFMDCFAEALTKAYGSPLALIEPLSLLGLGADSTWRPVPCDEEDRGYFWALGRLLALALVYRCPCPIPLSLLIFKCLLGMPLRPGDVRQLDPDFWNHRVRPLLEEGGAEDRQRDLKAWGMDALTFVSADGLRELEPGGKHVKVTDANKEEYAQLLCEDFLIGPVRAELSCLVMGFHELVPQDALNRQHLDAEQLRMLVCGTAEIDVDEWEAHAVLEGPVQVGKWFFDWLRKQPQVSRSKMLAFATGSSVLPCGWQGLRDPNGQPLPFRLLVDGNPEALPSAHTCTNLMVLPPVSKRADLERRLDQVLELAGREMLIA